MASIANVAGVPPLERSEKMGLYKRVFAYTQRYKRIFWTGVLFAFGISLLSPLRPYFVKITIDKFITPGARTTDPDLMTSFIYAIVWILILQFVLLAADALVRFFFTIQMARVGLRIVREIRSEVYLKILGLKPANFDKTPVGYFTTRTVNDVESMNNIFSEGFVPMAADILSIVIVLISMFWVDWKITLISLIPIPLVFISSLLFRRSVNRSFEKVRTAVSRLNSFTQEHLSNMSLIQTLGIEHEEGEKFKRINNSHRSAHVQGIFAYSVFYPIIEIIAALGLCSILFFTLKLKIDASEIVFFFLAINQIFRPLRYLADRFSTIQMGVIAARRVFNVLDSDAIIPSPKDGIKDVKIRGEIRFSKVCFSYVPDHPVLKDISFHVRAGEKVALVGYSGHGKTSIISLINRLYTYDSGAVCVDEVPVENYDLHFLRSQITSISQHVFLFAGSIRKNITLDNPHISDEDVQKAAEKIGLHKHIMRMPGGYNYMISERGANLSNGQRQLVCMARALAQNTPILIMDEATSDMDSETEEAVQNALKILAQDRTTIIIAHRLSTVREVDKILFIEHGRVAESGTHESLLAARGKYYNLCNTRSGDSLE